jgi:DedD protein
MPRVSDNDNLELKKRSRRRLVGAATLALIAAIVLPMVMDSEPVTTVRDIQVSIPERTLDSTPIPTPPQPLPADTVASPPASDAVAPEVEQAVRPVEPPASEPPVAAEKPQAPPPRPAAATSTPDKPVPATEPPRAAAPAASSAPDAEAERAKAILEDRAPAQPAPGAGQTEFVVQVGAFSDPAKAASRQIELAARGFKSYIERADDVSRVRIGPFASRADAEAMLRRLQGASLDGVVSTR